MVDLALLRCIKYREQWEKVHSYIPMAAVSKHTKVVVKSITKYFKQHQEAEQLDINSFRSLFFTSYNKQLSESDIEHYNNVLDRIEEDVPEDVKRTLINQLIELEFATLAANLIHEYNLGEDIEIVDALNALVEKTKLNLERVTDFQFADIEEAFEEKFQKGYEWALDCLNASMRNLSAGDFMIVAARVDKGKTSFLAHNLTHMAKQSDKDIIWLNNEGMKGRILRRCMQSALNVTNSELDAMFVDGTIKEKYTEAVGRPDKIQVFDIHQWNTYKVAELIDNFDNVGLIVFDMLDNVTLGSGRSDARTDQILEQQYQWARELAVKKECAIIATSQVSQDGAGLEYPSDKMLKDSKTGKQGACDAILMIGHVDDPTREDSRFLSLPKNKLKKEGSPSLYQEVLFDRDRGRFLNPE